MTGVKIHRVVPRPEGGSSGFGIRVTGITPVTPKVCEVVVVVYS